jgi:outer membrane protein assembly factor BamB
LSEGKRVWSAAVEYDLVASPSACSLGVLFPTSLESIECYSPADGLLLWSVGTGSRLKSSPIIVAGNFLYTTVDGKTVMGSMEDGRPIWETDLKVPVVAPISSDGEAVYVGGHRGQIYKLGISDGRIEWSATLDGPIKGGPSIFGNIVIFATLNHEIFFVDKIDGRVLLEYATEGMVSSRPVICPNGVFVAGEDENLYCFQMLRENE